jgi:hypothetical protein
LRGWCEDRGREVDNVLAERMLEDGDLAAIVGGVSACKTGEEISDEQQLTPSQVTLK